MYAATYTRDDLGRIATKTETVQGVTTTHAYGYDARGRLATVHTNGTLTATWGYDANGNRISQVTPAGTTVGLVDDQDRLLAWGAASFAYDANGDLTTRTDSAGLTSYDYDLFGNLRRVDLPAGDVVEYLIDGQNRRVGRVLNGAVTHKWLYKDQLNPVAELDAAGNVVARFIYGTTYHAPDVMLKGGATYRLIMDHLGSVRLVVDVATGAVAQRLDYDEWGRVLVDTNPGFQPFGFAGGLYDHATGLVRFGARDYDAEVGRWTAKDPIRFAGGDENIYAYVGGDPVNLVDPGGRFVGQALGAVGDFLRNYQAMRRANTIDADKYFHCMANCEATRRGSFGEAVAAAISNTREAVDRYVKGDPPSACAEDQAANAAGRAHGRDRGSDAPPCSDACTNFRPSGLR
jgi:RHS repeat-associated protein